MEKNIKDLKYVLISGKFPSDPYGQELHNKAYLYWEKFWNDVFKQNGTDDKVNPDNFSRQDIIALFMEGEEIIAQQCYSLFNFDSLATQNHSYMVTGYNEEFLKQMKEKDIHSVMTMEYISVMPSWRKKNCGVSLAIVLMGLACKHQMTLQTDSIITISRADNKVTQLITDNLGGEIVVGNLSMHNTPIDLVIVRPENATLPPDIPAVRAINKFWSEKLDLTQNVPLVKRKAA